jgi:hemerythrin
MATAWNESMTTGVPLVDNEHQELFRQVDKLNQAMLQGKGRDDIKKILDFVGDYVVTHFAHEEKIMEDYRCPIANANKAAHSKFIGKLMELQTRFAGSGASSGLAIEIHDILRNWLIEHINQIDIQLLACTKTAAKNASPAMSK